MDRPSEFGHLLPVDIADVLSQIGQEGRHFVVPVGIIVGGEAFGGSQERCRRSGVVGHRAGGVFQTVSGLPLFGKDHGLLDSLG
jgi:hypothetical protein